MSSFLSARPTTARAVLEPGKGTVMSGGGADKRGRLAIWEI